MAITITKPSAPAKTPVVPDEQKEITKLQKQKDTLKNTLNEINKYKTDIQKSLSTLANARAVVSAFKKGAS